MTELSPAAQAVWDAAWANSPVQCGDIEGTRRAQVAAALRAAADQVVDQVVPKFWHEDNDIYGETMQDVRQNLLAIAAELEGAQ